MTEMGSDKANSSIKFLILIGCILSAIAIASVGFWNSMDSSRPVSELPVLKAEKSNFKFKPENPGGKIIPHQDSKVLEILEGIVEKDNRTEKLRLPDAAPELPPVASKKDNNAENQESLMAKNSVEAKSTNVLSSSNVKSGDNGRKSNIINNKINLTDIIDSDNTTLAAEESRETPIQNDKVNEYKREKTFVSQPVLSKQTISKGTHRVQLAAFAKQEKAKQQAAILMEKHKMRLDDILLEVTQIDTGSSGIYWRVITEPLSKELAISTCNLLKSVGQDCIVRKIRKEG